MLLWLLVFLLWNCSLNEPVKSNELAEVNEKKTTNTSLLSPDEDDKEETITKQAKLSDKSGKNWKISKQKLGNDDLTDVFYVDENHGWIIGIKGDELAPRGGSLYKTNDGGKTWIKSEIKLPKESYISNIFFLDRLHGWIVIQTLENEKHHIDTRIQLLETLDGGKTWKPGYDRKNSFVNKLTINESGEGWIAGVKGKATYYYNADALVLHTVDFGKTWEDVSPKFVVVDENDPKRELLTSDFLTDISPAGEMKAVIISRGGKILKTDDAGKTWKKEAQLTGEEYSIGFQRMQPIKDADFLAVSRAGGVEGTWSLFTTVNKSKIKWLLNEVLLTDFAVLSDGAVITCGLKNVFDGNKSEFDLSGVILSSADLENWDTIYNSFDECSAGCELNKMAKVSDKKLFIVGGQGTFISISTN